MHNVTFRCVRETVVAVAKKYALHIMCVCSHSYPAREVHGPYYIVICGLFGSTNFYSTLLHKQHDFQEKLLDIKCVF